MIVEIGNQLHEDRDYDALKLNAENFSIDAPCTKEEKTEITRLTQLL